MEDKSLYGDKKRDEQKVDISSEDSPVNTPSHISPDESLTRDESADTDPNDVPNKASFDKNRNDRTRFDGEIGI